MLESYGRAYESLLKLQQLFEMEEIIELKAFQKKLMDVGREKGELKSSMQKEVNDSNLKRIWRDGLELI